jgi:peptidyl-prolyl cis-trans isomerase C
MYMISLRRIAPPTLAALLMAALPLAAFAEQTPAKPAATPIAEAKTAPGDVMVRVNGTPISRQEVDRAVKVLLAQNQVQQPSPEVLKQAQSAALEQLISAELLYQQAAKLEVKDLDKQVADRLAVVKAKFPSEADYESALKGVDMTVQDIQEFTRKDIIINNLIDKRFAAPATVSESETRKFYDENLEKYFKKPETARASHILIGVDGKASAEDRKKAKEKAEAILQRVKKGEDFAAIAKAESTCPSSSQGGDLGSFGRGQMVPPFENAVFAMKPGEVSNVVETQFGYHVIKLTEKHEASAEKYEEVKGKIQDHLKREKVQKALADYIEQTRKDAKIEKL